jgi:hypothetical protein
MGTNYYIQEPCPNPCAHCRQRPDATPTHTQEAYVRCPVTVVVESLHSHVYSCLHRIGHGGQHLIWSGSTEGASNG